MPDLKHRLEADEMMDDFSITDDRLRRALDELRWVNRLLGGYATMKAVLRPWLHTCRGQTVQVLDLGTGVADYPEVLVRWAEQLGVDVQVTALDANPATVAYAGQVLDRRLPPALRRRIILTTGDALALPYPDRSFDLVMAAMFLHHFAHGAAVQVVREMHRLARHGLLINDLHRHPLAWAGIRSLVAVLPVSPMFHHDGPLSVRRAFCRTDLAALAQEAGLPRWHLHWHWAFRWSLTTLAPPFGARDSPP
jgi:SAM-dependent methyltransferase